MAISLSTTELDDKTRPEYAISDSISASGSLSESITNVTATYNAPPAEPNLVITPGTTTVTFGGSVADPFSDTFKYVDAGRTDLEDTPTTHTGVDTMPQEKIMYDLNQDMTPFVTRTFTVVVTYDETPPNGSATGLTYTEDVTLKIYNSWEGIRSFVANYNFPSC